MPRSTTRAQSALDVLLKSPEPSVRWKVRIGALGEDPQSKAIRDLREEIRASPRVEALLAHRDTAGRIVSGRSVYAKWQGAHWILAALADLGYPEHDETLLPVREQILDTWLKPEFYTEFVCERRADAYKQSGVPRMQGRCRSHASQQGNALYFLLKLGLESDRVHDLVERLLHWQWPDGGWNCDTKPGASKSTFIHTIHAMRGLYFYGRKGGSQTRPYRFRQQALDAARAASGIFLSRRLYKRQSNGAVMKAEFVKLHYPLYWHYDYLFGLRVMAETGHLRDPRCAEALDLLEAKQLPEGGWPAESRYYTVSKTIKLGNDFVDWGGTSTRRMNPWVTADALAVLVAAGRWKLKT